MKLVDDARDWWTWNSVHVFLILSALPPVWVTLPPEIKAAIPPGWLPWIYSLVALGGIVARVRAQK